MTRRQSIGVARPPVNEPRHRTVSDPRLPIPPSRHILCRVSRSGIARRQQRHAVLRPSPALASARPRRPDATPTSGPRGGQAPGAGPDPDRLRPRPGRRRHRRRSTRSSPSCARQFPLLHERLELTRGHTTTACSSAGPAASAERPVVLMAHLDVVPVDGDAPGSTRRSAPTIVDGAIWGRGTLDDKGCAGRDLRGGRAPARGGTSCRPRTSGSRSAATRRSRAAPRRRPSSELARRGVRPWFVLDEGGAIAHDAFPGVGRRSASSASPRRASPRSSCASRAAAGTPRPRPGRTRPPGWPAPILRLETGTVARQRSRSRRSSCCARLAPHAPRAAAPAAGQRRPAAAGCSPARCVAAGAESAAMTRTTVAVTTLSGSPGAQRHRLDRHGRGQPADHGRRHRRPACSSTSARRSTTTRSSSSVVEANEPSPVSPTRRRRVRAARVHDRRGRSPTPCPRRT